MEVSSIFKLNLFTDKSVTFSNEGSCLKSVFGFEDFNARTLLIDPIF